MHLDRCRLENTMSKPMIRIGLIIALIAVMALGAWYFLQSGKKAVYTDAVLVQNHSQVAEETKDCFLLQEDDISV